MAESAKAAQKRPSDAVQPAKRPRVVPDAAPDEELAKAPQFGGRWQRGGVVTLRRVPWSLRNDSGRVLRSLKADGLAVIPGMLSQQQVLKLRRGTADWIGVDAMLRQTQTGGHLGTDDIKVIQNRDRDNGSGDKPERWESRWSWKGQTTLIESVVGGLNKHAPEMVARWKQRDEMRASLVMTRKFTPPQRWHMDMASWTEKDKKYGLAGEWVLVFVVLYGSAQGSEGVAPDVCPWWPSKWVYQRETERPSEMIYTRPRLAPGDCVVVRASMLHRGGGGMDRGVAFVPFKPTKNYYETANPFATPWLPWANGVNIREVDPAQAP
eukprot:TRINITY_DN32279_c0_g1_i1.p1 TRINITY_DN32279_c0_g1~~TRINITY_DN32279_c0_g1_i1.p1  ORF type:complete len:323 (+),score=100.87 TRINITY_DN32279_c0_g1_i1:55-1023(+)